MFIIVWNGNVQISDQGANIFLMPYSEVIRTELSKVKTLLFETKNLGFFDMTFII